MNYLSSELVFGDISHFANSIKSNYNVEDCTVYDANENGNRFIGYDIRIDGKRYIVKMEYSENEAGELAIKAKHWTVVREDGKIVASELASLGDVFELLHVKKV